MKRIHTNFILPKETFYEGVKEMMISVIYIWVYFPIQIIDKYSIG